MAKIFEMQDCVGYPYRYGIVMVKGVYNCTIVYMNMTLAFLRRCASKEPVLSEKVIQYALIYYILNTYIHTYIHTTLILDATSNNKFDTGVKNLKNA